MSFKDKIKEVLKETRISTLEEYFFYGEIEYGLPEDWDDNIKPEIMEEHGGEGEGDQYWKVISFTEGNDTVYVKFYGWYASYNGAEYQGYHFVNPKTVEVVQWV